ncbi:MAG: A/G-specific adenine glycosylase [Promethearchaeota archaeon]|nr:MAG: A/G-specific adenine glycosylase [Candidatus Lokiarchaeota archaeon]
MSKIREELFISDFHRLFKKNGLSIEVIESFQKIIYEFYRIHKRKFPFREKISPYNVLVSEIMLQQTQTGRVSEKFRNFIEKFPDFISLSQASVEDILKEWKGLGYNRRALALKRIAEIIINEYNGKLPDSVDTLKKLPQIGNNTASSIIAFAFNKPTIFIETNIRTVFIYFFFPYKEKVKDKDILSIVQETIDKSNPRKWYYALMDYGVMLKKTHPELKKRSAHYRKQAPFRGSNRQIRGKLIEILIKEGSIEISKIQQKLKVINPDRIKKVLDQLKKEGFIDIKERTVKFTK